MAEATTSGNSYVGRFAPSPTGPLHFGSLLAALASYLDAKANAGIWYLRMEDLDPPREPAGTADLILNQLSDLGLHWDGEVLYQSKRLDAYEDALTTLAKRGHCFQCDCSRPRIRELGSVYDGHCRQRNIDSANKSATRVQVTGETISFVDNIQGHFSQHLEREVGDFILRRKDGLFAYQLAVVIDDGFQGINQVIRGYDLLDSTPRQIFLQRLLDLPTPTYAHVPIVTNSEGQKLSKQHFAAPIDANNLNQQIFSALEFLGQKPASKLKSATLPSLLESAVACWDIHAVPKLANMPLCSEH